MILIPEKVPGVDLIDLHNHILPGCDDGSQSLEESLEMARIACAAGIRTIVATPHASGMLFGNPKREVLPKMVDLNAAVRAQMADMSIVPGSEVLLGKGTAKKVIAGEILTIADNGRFVLVEFPFEKVPKELTYELDILLENEIVPIIAHPERNSDLRKNPHLVFELAKKGCLFQITAGGVAGELGKPAMRFSRELIKHRVAHFIATDSHSPTRRPPDLREAVGVAAQLLDSKEEAWKMVTSNPAAIIGGDVPEIPEPVQIERKKWFFQR